MKKGGKNYSLDIKPAKGKKRLKVQRREPSSDYLKYYRVARYWARRKYNVNQNDLEVLLFLYSERFFTKTKFRQYENIFEWEKARWDKLSRDKWISMWRRTAPGQHAIYEVSLKGKRMMASFYKKLEGKENYPTDAKQNPVFDRKVCTYTDKVFSSQMLKINKENDKRKGK
jgi:hypothetical protein